MWPLSFQEVSLFLGVKPKEEFESWVFEGVSLDSRTIEERELFFAIPGENFDPHEFVLDVLKKKGTLAFVEKDNYQGVPFGPRAFVVKNAQEAFRLFATEFRKRLPFPVIGIGGSNGKTTTKELIYTLLQEGGHFVTKTEKSQNGFIGIPMTLCQKSHNDKNKIHALVLEIGIDTVDSMEEHIAVSKPDIVTLTALGPEHLVGLKSWEIARAEELKLISKSRDLAVWQLCDPYIKEEFEAIKPFENDIVITEENSFNGFNGRTIYIENIAPWQGGVAVTLQDEGEREEYCVPLSGKHNGYNFAISYAIARHLGQSIQNIKAGLLNLKAPEMRTEIFPLKEKNILYNDCYNSSPFSLKAAIENLNFDPILKNKNKVLFLGDMLELADGSKLWHQKAAQDLMMLNGGLLCFYGEAMYDCYQELNVRDIKKQFKTLWRPRQDDPVLFLSDLETSILTDTVFLVKGSRGMRLERVSKALSLKYAHDP